MIYIYSLAHPLTNEVRYIGKTNNLKKRYYGHTNVNSLKNGLHLTNWLRSLNKNGLKPIMEIVDEVSESEWRSSEIYWIAQFKSWGFRLVNLTDGGDGLVNYKPSEETKRKIGLASSKWIRPKSLGENISKAKKGKRLHPNSLKASRLSVIRAIFQYTKKGVLIKEWLSIEDASKKLNINKGNLQSACSGNRKSAGGYFWRYKTTKYVKSSKSSPSR